MTKTIAATVMLLFLTFQPPGRADTFTHKTKDGIVYTGYATNVLQNNLTTVVTVEAGNLDIDLSDYTIERNAKGRNPIVPVLPITNVIEYEYQIAAFETAIAEEANKGPLLLLIELDTPGGRVDHAKRYCAAIQAITNCKTVAFIPGGQNGGAYSAGAAISLACDEIYMAPGTCIGAATMITHDDAGHTVDLKKAYGEAVGEKFNSAWRTYLASLAQDGNRSGALAKAMADKDIVVVEVKRKGKTLFIEPEQQAKTDVYVQTVCKKGELLTLPADQAKTYGLADAVVSSRSHLMRELGISDAAVESSAVIANAQADYEKALQKFDRLKEKIDLQFKELVAKSQHNALTRRDALKDFDALRRSSEYLLRLKQSYPDIPVSEEAILDLVNSIKAEHTSIKSMR